MKRLLAVSLSLAFLLFLTAFAGENGKNDFSKVWDSSLDDTPEALWDVENVGDTDGDGYEEFLTCTDEEGVGLYLYECTGADNQYEKVWTYIIGSDKTTDSYVLSHGDLDGDGKVELLAGTWGTDSAPNSVFIFEWDGVEGENNYTLSTMMNMSTILTEGGLRVSGIHAEDVDKDGVEELLMAVRPQNDIYVVSLDTASSFDFPTWNTEFHCDSATYSMWAFTVGDFDADGKTEFATVEADYNAVLIIEVEGPDTYRCERYFRGMTSPNDGYALRAVNSADLDGNGFTEIIITSTNCHLYIVENKGDCGAIDTTMVHDVLAYTDSSFMQYLKYDMMTGKLGDADMFFGSVGQPDLYIAGIYSITDLEFTGTDYTDPNDWTFTEILFDSTTDNYQDIALGDFDNDGLKDFVVVNTAHSPWLVVYEKEDLESNFKTTVQQDSTEFIYQVRGLCAGSDLNKNGKKEVFLTDYRNGGFIHGFEVNGDVLEWFWSSDTIKSSVYAANRNVVTGDLDNDGNGEVIFAVSANASDLKPGLWIYEYNPISGKLDIFARLNIDDGLLNDRYRFENIQKPFDIDGDGKQEILLSNNGSNNTIGDRFYIISVDGTFESGFYSATIEASWNQGEGIFKGSPYYANYGDLDGDGTYEVVLAAWDNGGLYLIDVTGADTYVPIKYISADPLKHDAVPYGGTTIADFDGDGRDEVACPMYTGNVAEDYYTTILNIDGALTDATDANVGFIRGPWLGAGIGHSKAADFDGDGKFELYGSNYSTHAQQFSCVGSNPLLPESWEVKSVISELTVDQNALGLFAMDVANDLNSDGGGGSVVVGYLESHSFMPNGVWLKVAEFEGGSFVQKNYRIVTPDDYKLSQNFPNPFNPNTQIEFEIPLEKDVTLSIYDMRGYEVIKLVNAHKEAGKYTVNWNGKNAAGANVAAGSYIYQLRAGHVTKTGTMTLLK